MQSLFHVIYTIKLSKQCNAHVCSPWLAHHHLQPVSYCYIGPEQAHIIAMMHGVSHTGSPKLKGKLNGGFDGWRLPFLSAQFLSIHCFFRDISIYSQASRVPSFLLQCILGWFLFLVMQIKKTWIFYSIIRHLLDQNHLLIFKLEQCIFAYIELYNVSYNDSHVAFTSFGII